MYKMNKMVSFHISREEKEAIEVLRNKGIVISKFLRRSLMDKAMKIIKQDKREQHLRAKEWGMYDRT